MLINEQVAAVPVPNPISHLPSISTSDMVTIMRIDKTKGSDRIANYIADAYDVINRQLPVGFMASYRSHPCCHPNDLVVAIADASQKQRAYKRAVMHEAAALMVDDNIDYETTSQGSIRGEAQLSKSDRQRRIVNHAVADMTGRTRNRIKLV